MFGVALDVVTDTPVPLLTEQLPPRHGRLSYSCGINPDAVGGFARTKYDPDGSVGEMYPPCASVVADHQGDAPLRE
jgi:hypothetical protein